MSFRVPHQMPTPNPTQVAAQRRSQALPQPRQAPEPHHDTERREKEEEYRYTQVRKILQGLQSAKDGVCPKTGPGEGHFIDEDADDEPRTLLPGQEFPKKVADDAALPIIRSAKYYLRCIDLYTPIEEVLEVGLVCEGKMTSQEFLDMDDDEAVRHKKLYNKLVKHCPDLRVLLDTLYELRDETSRRFAFKRLKSIASTCKSSDSTNLFGPILEYIPKTPKDKKPRLNAGTPRETSRGINDKTIAALFAPRNLHKYVIRPHGSSQRKRASMLLRSAIASIQSGKVRLLATGYPWFLYGEYDPEDRMQGLFRGYLLFRVARHIFTSPSSAMNRSWRKSNKGNDFGLEIKEAESAMIAYVALQTRHCLAATKCWSEVQGEFNNVEFYYFIIDTIRGGYLNDPEFQEYAKAQMEPLEHSEQATADEREEAERNHFEEGMKAERERHEEWRRDLIRTWNLELFGNKKGRRTQKRAVPDAGDAPQQAEARIQLMRRDASPEVEDSGPEDDHDQTRKRTRDSDSDDSTDSDDDEDGDGDREPPAKRSRGFNSQHL
ncbi:hypothetical protein V5O48_006843 [Marasmius crinis-equi]|uniref:Uncharacterized protein n=1 Tax=Marasmius crinis-equi TaxID=585013 RepID=A0ABR3FIC1_9AGAR